MVRLDEVSLGEIGQAGSLRGLSFALAPGSFHVLTGPAGCGKTSVLDVIGMARWPEAGRVELFGRDTAALDQKDRPRLRRRIGRLFAKDRLIDHLSVFDNAALVPRLAGRRRRDYGPEVAQVLAWVGLGGKAGAPPADLNAGERRRLALARAVAGAPEIVLADEPIGGLGDDAGLRVLCLLAEINQAGTAVLMATADEDLAASSGAPVLRLREGRLTLVQGFEPAVAP
ncbi:MAG: cell division ATP-binding protein FtsE [Caulobacteraceae bacterium]